MGYRILVINWRDIKNPYVGGAEVNFQEIFKRLVRRGHEVTLLCSRHDHTFPEEEWIDDIRIIRRGNRFAFNYAVPRIYKNEFSNANIDILIEDCNKVPFFTPLYAQHPLFVIIHHLHGTSIYGDAFLPAAMYVHLTEKMIPLFYKNVPFVTVSRSTKHELVRKGLKPEDIEVVHNGVDHESYTPDESVRSSQPLIACVTRLKKYKGIHLLLRAMKYVQREIPEARLIITGSGTYAPELYKLTHQLKLEHSVEFTGFLEVDQKVDIYRKAQVVVNPSAKEGWGLTVIEANACGTPVIAAKVPGLIDSVIDGETGFLYPHSDLEAMAAHIIRLLRDENLRKKFSARSIEWAKEFTWQRAAEKMEEMMETVMSGQRGRRKFGK